MLIEKWILVMKNDYWIIDFRKITIDIEKSVSTVTIDFELYCEKSCCCPYCNDRNKDAYYFLGKMYFYGQNVQKNYEKAFKYDKEKNEKLYLSKIPRQI